MSAPRLVLASRSPQRRAILEQIGVDFEVVVPEVEELGEGEPGAVVVENALRKARAAAGQLVLGCDTEVVSDGRVYGKPRDEREAERFLRELSGREHQVVSGLALIEAGRERTAASWTRVTFRELDEPTLRWYLASGEWRERAGGYAIQGRGAALVAAVAGDYLNVVGLPLATLLELKPSLPLLHR
ncbi:MAG TPA: Maf family nucleotide pyrophosphatase [Thermoleophilaceae bacterium]|nr:Maf family nucleotide pyrophosphatase [Thermoleophilaceae bacterium]